MISKLIYILDSRMPTEKAYGYQSSKMCEQFANLGVAVELWSPKRKNHITEDIFSFYNLKNNFKHKIIHTPELAFLPNFLRYWQFLLQNLLFFVKLIFIKIDKQAIVYSRSSLFCFLAILKHRKTVYECHDWFAKGKFFHLSLLKFVDKIVVTNYFIKEQFIKHNFVAGKILVSPNGVDLSIFDLTIDKKQARLKVNNIFNINNILDKKILFYSGSFKTMGNEKGLKEVITVLSKLSQDFILLAVGGNQIDIQYYQKIAIDLEIEDKVYFLPKQKQNILAILQKASDVLLMPFPKIAHYEFFMTPLKMFEYMASQRPIVASNLPSIKQILDDTSCLFYRVGDLEDLKNKIILAVSDEGLVEKISFSAHLKVQQYDWQKRANNILNFIQ
ncbi:MAG: Glycosyl transferase group 1 [Parcubacteria group bacterium GW2011_GWA2_36_10]|nr:MAG: Glycosyl transferase group 1 [Parcubacteria group bacterium GW2011_GWA2_36_10]